MTEIITPSPDFCTAHQMATYAVHMENVID